jgi:hypothetical protein
MKNMSIERVIFGCFEFTLLGHPKYTKALRKQTSDLSIRRLLKAETLLHFVGVVSLGFKSILVL